MKGQDTLNPIPTTEHLKNNRDPQITKHFGKMSKRLIYFVFAISTIIVFTSITGCKKGENDPFLSLKSRRARISGEWKLKEGVVTYQSNFGGSPTNVTTTYTETTITTNGASVPYSETLTIGEDGTYTLSVTEDGVNVTVSGVWFFVGKIKDLGLKNKEAILLNGQEFSEVGYSETYSGLYEGEPLIIDQLKDNEVIFKGETSHDTGSGNYGSSSTYERTFEKQ